jgi:hypothetical protein
MSTVALLLLCCCPAVAYLLLHCCFTAVCKLPAKSKEVVEAEEISMWVQFVIHDSQISSLVFKLNQYLLPAA